MTPDPRKVRFGLVACSSIARRRMAQAIQTSSHACIEAVGSRSTPKAEEFAKAFSVKKFGSYQSVLDDPEVDAVYISTPVTEHKKWVEKAALAGKHILCEKPAFTSLQDAHEMVSLCARHKTLLMEGYMFLFHPQHSLVRSLIQEGRIGEPRFFLGEFTYPRPPAENIRMDPALCGGVFYDAAGYAAAAVRYVFGEQPESLICQITPDEIDGLDSAVAMTAGFSGGRTAQMFSGFGLYYRSRYSVLGTKGRIEVNRAYAVSPEQAVTVTLETEAGIEIFSLDPDDQFRKMVDAFAFYTSSPETHFGPLVQELLERQAVMSAAWQSHVEKRAVKVCSLEK